MPFVIWCLTILLLLSALGVSDAFDACGYRKKLRPGRRFGLESPDYPNRYPTSASCRWYLKSDTRVRLTCNEFNVVPSPDCQSDFLQVFTNPSLPALIFCGSRSLSLESDDKEMNITLKTAVNTPGGSFNCHVEAVEEKEQCTCGRRNSIQSRIVDGAETGVNEYPMMASLIDSKKGILWCGATIISNKHVLIAAHCLLEPGMNISGILVGDHDLKTGAETSATRLYKVARYDTYPLYESSKKATHDIAVVTVDGTIEFSNEVGPVCLPFRHRNRDSEGSSRDVLGWGATSYGGPTSNVLLKTSLTVRNVSACKEEYPKEEDINYYSHLCTYTAGKDSCQFDSGGPVLWQNPDSGRLVLLGVTSFGNGCGGDSPSVSTRVDPYLDWIVSVTPGAQYCQAE